MAMQCSDLARARPGLVIEEVEFFALGSESSGVGAVGGQSCRATFLGTT